MLSDLFESIVWNQAENFPFADDDPYPYVRPQAIVGGVFAQSVGEWEGYAVNMSTL